MLVKSEERKIKRCSGNERQSWERFFISEIFLRHPHLPISCRLMLLLWIFGGFLLSFLRFETFKSFLKKQKKMEKKTSKVNSHVDDDVYRRRAKICQTQKLEKKQCKWVI
jgi:beta-lactamase regulating signal transducer with metallopeptidase domain